MQQYYFTESGYQKLKNEIDENTLIEHNINELKRIHSTSVQKDEVNIGSVAIVNFSVLSNGEEVSKANAHPFTILENQEPPFGENLVGMKLGEERVEEIELPKEFGEHAGKKAKVSGKRSQAQSLNSTKAYATRSCIRKHSWSTS